jgi:hypothetical protein
MPEGAVAGLLDEVPESRATGEVRRIYGEIRRLAAVPMVATIFRHLATMPGVLAWSWGLLEPAMRSGALQREAWALAERVDLGAVPAIPRAALRAAGLCDRDERAIAAVLDAYNRANPVNILALRCLALHLGGVCASAAPPVAHGWEPPPAPEPLPPIADPVAMGPALRELVVLLTDRGETAAPSTLWPGLYRHLAHWPAFLGYASVIVPPRFDAIDAAAAKLRAGIDAAAAELAGSLRAPAALAAPAAAERERLQRAIAQFSRRIPEMAVIGTLLRRALP